MVTVLLVLHLCHILMNHSAQGEEKKTKQRRKKVQKRTMNIADVAYAFGLWFAVIHLDYLKACDEWVTHKIVLSFKSLTVGSKGY